MPAHTPTMKVQPALGHLPNRPQTSPEGLAAPPLGAACFPSPRDEPHLSLRNCAAVAQAESPRSK